MIGIQWLGLFLALNPAHSSEPKPVPVAERSTPKVHTIELLIQTLTDQSGFENAELRCKSGHFRAEPIFTFIGDPANPVVMESAHKDVLFSGLPSSLEGCTLWFEPSVASFGPFNPNNGMLECLVSDHQVDCTCHGFECPGVEPIGLRK